MISAIVAEIGIPLLIEQLKTIVIPTISGKFETPIGHFDYDLSKFVTNLSAHYPVGHFISALSLSLSLLPLIH